MLGDGQCQEGTEGRDGDSREENTHEEEAAQPFEPGPPVILQVHHMSHQDPQCQDTCGDRLGQQDPDTCLSYCSSLLLGLQPGGTDTRTLMSTRLDLFGP